MDPTRHDRILDQLVAEFSDEFAQGKKPVMDTYLQKAPESQRPNLERCLRMIENGMAAVPQSVTPLIPGAKLQGFEIRQALGRGGMATVFEAWQPELNRVVALKVLRPGLAMEPRHVERFHREAQAIAQLQHPHIVQVYAVGQEQGHHFIAMEHVPGPTLADVLGKLPPNIPWTAEHLAEATGINSLGEQFVTFEQALAHLFKPVAEAVAFAHEHGIVHRDLKPSNILIHRDGRAMVADFGLAKGEGDMGLTFTGEPLGTPYYMAPEQLVIATQNVDERSDVYSLGVTMFEALSGRRPYEGETALAIFDAIRNHPMPHLRQWAPYCSQNAAAVTRKAMARDPMQRYGNATELAKDLGLLAEGGTPAARTDQGGCWRRFRSAMEDAQTPSGFEYQSPNVVMGLPLVHINMGMRRKGQPQRHAKGWLAIGRTATGVVAFGGLWARGVFAFAGAFATGVVSGAGSFSLGLFSMAGAAAAGIIAIAGGAGFGWLGFGGCAAGHYAVGGAAFGTHTISGMGKDPQAVEFLESNFNWLIAFFEWGTSFYS